MPNDNDKFGRRWSNVVAARAAGRCADGAQRDGGRVHHAVRSRGATIFSHERAVCGFVPGRLSAGWVTDDPAPNGVTCKTCRARLDRKET